MKGESIFRTWGNTKMYTAFWCISLTEKFRRTLKDNMKIDLKEIRWNARIGFIWLSIGKRGQLF